VNFRAVEEGVPALAWIVDVPPLEQRLAEAVKYQPMIEVIDAPQPAPLTVVCEGRTSSTREEFKVHFEVSAYSQQAIAARFTCEIPHGGVARQWFCNGDVLALLPMGGAAGNSVALVWSVQDSKTAELLQLPPAEFQARVEGASHNLGLADAEALAQVLHEREYWRSVGDIRLLRRYERSRKAAVMAMSFATDG